MGRWWKAWRRGVECGGRRQGGKIRLVSSAEKSRAERRGKFSEAAAGTTGRSSGGTGCWRHEFSVMTSDIYKQSFTGVISHNAVGANWRSGVLPRDGEALKNEELLKQNLI